MNLIKIDNQKIYGRFREEFCEPCKGKFDLVIQECFKNHGFIAGGFARFLYKIQDQTKTAWLESVKKYIGTAHSDIDFFFHSMNSRDEALKEINKYHSSDIRSPFATTLRMQPSVKSLVSFDYEIPVQLVGIVTGDMEKVLDQFDFYNSMFCFNECKALASSDGIEAENKNELNICHFGSSNLPTRIRKYMEKHNFSGLSNDSRTRFIDWCFQVATWLKSSDIKSFPNNHFATFCTRVKKLTFEKKIFTDADLLMLSSIFGSPGGFAPEDFSQYMHAFEYNLPDIIVRRAEVEPIRVDWNKAVRK